VAGAAAAAADEAVAVSDAGEGDGVHGRLSVVAVEATAVAEAAAAAATVAHARAPLAAAMDEGAAVQGTAPDVVAGGRQRVSSLLACVANYIFIHRMIDLHQYYIILENTSRYLITDVTDPTPVNLICSGAAAGICGFT
jgi:hypothetical protein